jgi:hypothetical protein
MYLVDELRVVDQVGLDLGDVVHGADHLGFFEVDY